MKLIEKIFSVKNSNNHKIWTIFGLKFKFKNTNKMLYEFFNSNFNQISKKLNLQIETGKNVNSQCQNINNNLNSIKSFLGIAPRSSAVQPISHDDICNISDQKELVMNIKCPYCSSEKIYPIREFSMNAMIKEYIDIYKFNPYSDLYKDLTLEKMHCFNCDLEFYNYSIPDSPLLYEKLLASGRYIYPKYKWEYKQAINLIKKYNLKRLLDIGCGEGYFLDKAKSLVDFAMGSEFNQTAIKRCRDKNLLISTKPLDEISEKFDFICMFQILEHISSPKVFLQDALNLLEPGGIIFVVTPNPYGVWCDSERPSVLNLPPHHCLDVTKEFFYNLAKDFPVEVVDYLQDDVPYWMYNSFVLNQPVKMSDHRYLSYLLERDKFQGHNHGIVFRKLK